MPNIKQTIQTSQRMLSDCIDVLRNESGSLEHEGHSDRAVLADQCATLLESASLLQDEAIRRLEQMTNRVTDEAPCGQCAMCMQNAAYAGPERRHFIRCVALKQWVRHQRASVILQAIRDGRQINPTIGE